MTSEKIFDENQWSGVYSNMSSHAASTLDDDASLVERAITGEKAAFDELTKKHLQRCYRVARRFGLPPEDAADVIQDTFLAAYRALDSFNFSFKFSTWITKILTNRLLNYGRGLKRAKRLFWRPPDAPRLSETWEVSSERTPEEQLENHEIHQLLLKAVAKLPQKQRLVFVLVEMEEMKSQEIAALFEIPEGTVNSRLYHARLSLRERLKNYL